MTALHRRPSTAVNGGLLVVIVAAGIWAATSIRDASADDATVAAGVRTVTVAQGAVTRSVTAYGSVESARTATATFATAGTVTEIAVKVGDRVRKGDVLARIDPAAAQRALALAQADRSAAQEALNRAENGGGGTASAQNAVLQADLAVEEAEAGLDGARLTAPMAGTVVAINGSLGGPSVLSGTGDSGAGRAPTGFIDLADLGSLQVSADFPEADATDLKAGQPATVLWNALQGAEATGRVEAVDPIATTSDSVVTYGVTVSLPKPPKGAKPGQTVTVSVVTGTAERTLAVNAAAVTTVGDRHTVTVLTPSGAQEVRDVEVGLAGDEAYEVKGGLTAGERVVLPTSATAGSIGRGGGLTGGAPPGGAPGGR